MGAAELELCEETLGVVLKLVHKHTGITMNEKKKALLQSRLRPRLRELKLVSYEDYVSYLEGHKDEVQTFIDRVTTNETYFYRTPRVWDYFNQKYLTAWFKAHPHETLKVWSGASSSGEEIYSIAICCLEFKQQHPEFKFELHATDISQEIIQTAQNGLYAARSIEGVQKYHPDWLAKYFSKLDETHWKISPEVKKHVKFSQHNLMSAYPQKKNFDIIFLRNVMIYFQESDQKKVLAHMQDALKNQGILVLGESESIGRYELKLTFMEPLVYRNEV